MRSLAELISREEGYLDVGTGSIIVQVLIAGLFGALPVIKRYWNRIKMFPGKILSQRRKTGETQRI